jgi:hypothetical protein
MEAAESAAERINGVRMARHCRGIVPAVVKNRTGGTERASWLRASGSEARQTMTRGASETQRRAKQGHFFSRAAHQNAFSETNIKTPHLAAVTLLVQWGFSVKSGGGIGNGAVIAAGGALDFRPKSVRWRANGARPGRRCRCSGEQILSEERFPERSRLNICLDRSNN